MAKFQLIRTSETNFESYNVFKKGEFVAYFEVNNGRFDARLVGGSGLVSKKLPFYCAVTLGS